MKYKTALAQPLFGYAGRRVMIFIKPETKVGDYVEAPNGEGYTVMEIVQDSTPEPKPKEPEDEYVLAKELEKGDQFWYQNEWCEVNNNYLHPSSPYAKLSVTPESKMDEYRNQRISGLYTKLDKSMKVRRKTRQSMEHLNICNAYDQQKVVIAKTQQLADIFLATPDAEGKLRLGTALCISKDTLIATARSELKTEFNKLSELMKKL